MDSFKYLDIFREDWNNFQIKKMNMELKNEVLVRKMSKRPRAPSFTRLQLAPNSPEASNPFFEFAMTSWCTRRGELPWTWSVFYAIEYCWLNSGEDNVYD